MCPYSHKCPAAVGCKWPGTRASNNLRATTNTAFWSRAPALERAPLTTLGSLSPSHYYQLGLLEYPSLALNLHAQHREELIFWSVTTRFSNSPEENRFLVYFLRTIRFFGFTCPKILNNISEITSKNTGTNFSMESLEQNYGEFLPIQIEYLS